MKKGLVPGFVFILLCHAALACSVIYYIDKSTGNIYVANNEDYWYSVKAYLQVEPRSENKHARVWYGWNKFAQGGVNDAGLFFDGAVTPVQEMPAGYHKPKGNLGDRILATCSTTAEAIAFLEKEKTALTNGHLMFGDRAGNAVVVEWVKGERKLIRMKDNSLAMTNFLLSDTTTGNYPCYRYQSIEDRLKALQRSNDSTSLKIVGNTLGGAAQLPQQDPNGKVGGTLYSTFIDLTHMQLVLIYKLDNAKITKLDLNETFKSGKRKKIFLRG